MKTIKSSLLPFFVGLIGFTAISISANETVEKNVMVQIHKLSDSNTKVDLDVNGHAEVFNLPDLEVGETKEIITESGESISVSKTESGITVNIGGEEVNLPSVGNEMAAHMIRGGAPLHTNVSKGIQVIGDLTEEQIAIIKDGFAAAGVEKEVKFTKGHEMRFFSIDGNKEGNFDIQFNSEDVKDWISKDGSHVKVIKMGKGDKDLHVETKVLVIKDEEDDQ